MSLRDDVVRLAQQEARRGLSVAVPSSSVHSTKSKYTAAMGWNADQWCADFVAWLVDSLDGQVRNNDTIRTSLLPSRDNARRVPAYTRLNNENVKYYSRGTYSPNPGDYVILYGKNHMGIVTSVNRSAGTFSYVDGNNTDGNSSADDGYRKVKEHSRVSYNNSSSVTGFVRVNYEKFDRITPDRYESNNTRGAATGLSGNTGSISANIHESGNVDYYRITLDTRGGSTNFVKTNFTHSQGDIDMELYNSAGSLVDYSRGSGNEERISLNGKSAGTYYVKVYGYGGATNKNYSLAWDTTPSVRPDRYEPNDSRYSAEKITGRSGVLSNLTLHTASDEDWFEFTLTGARKSDNHISITSGNNGEMIRIYDRNGTQVKSFQRSHNLSRLANGTYYAKVYSAVRLPSSSYTLSYDITPAVVTPIITPVRPASVQREYEPNNTRYLADSLSGTSGTLKGSIGSTGDEDWFKFVLNGTGASGSEIKLVSPKNSQFIVLYDANGRKLGSSMVKSISLAGRAAGTYYAKVYDGVDLATGGYTIAWNTASNSRAAAAPASRSMPDARSMMYDTSANAYASLLSSSGAATRTAAQSGNDSLRRFGALAQA